MAKLLIVDDEKNIREVVKKYALFEGHEVVEAGNGTIAIEQVNRQDFDLIIMDVMMPELDGFSACKEIFKIKSIPVIMLSARGEEYDKLHGFELGIDDYVVKPFSPKELMMRVNAILKRLHKDERDVYILGELTLDYKARIVHVKNQRIDLSLKEFELLLYLVKNKNIALTRDMLLEEVWGYDFYGDERTLDTHIKLLRKHLNEYASHIVTIRGVGYRFEE